MARVVRGNHSHIDGAAQVWAEATAFRDGDCDVAPLEMSRPVIAAVAGRERSVLVVAVDDADQVMAFAAAAPAADSHAGLASTADVEYVGVRPGVWGTGLAGDVLERLCAELASEGFARAQLWVYASNQRAVSVYERLGWREEGSSRLHRRTGEPEKRYRRTLGHLKRQPPGAARRAPDPLLAGSQRCVQKPAGQSRARPVASVLWRESSRNMSPRVRGKKCRHG